MPNPDFSLPTIVGVHALAQDMAWQIELASGLLLRRLWQTHGDSTQLC